MPLDAELFPHPHPTRVTAAPLTTAAGLQWHLSTTADSKTGETAQRLATVPGTYFTDIALPDPAIGANSTDPIYMRHEQADVSYQTTFNLPDNLPAPPLLIFESLQSNASVFLNGAALLTSENAFHPHAKVLPTDLLHPTNTLRVHFPSIRSQLLLRVESHTYREWNDPVGGVSSLRLPQYLAGWDWGPRQLCCGIVRPLNILHAPVAAVCDVACVQRIRLAPPVEVTLLIAADVALRDSSSLASTVTVRCSLRLRDGSADTEQSITLVSLSEGQAPQELSSCFANCRLRNIFAEAGDESASTHRFVGMLHVAQPRLWWPNGMGDQSLYTLDVAVLNKTEGEELVIIDECTQNLGLRQLELIQELTPRLKMNSVTGEEGDGGEGETVTMEKMSFVFAVNGRRFFSKGANFIPVRMDYTHAKSKEYEQTVLSARDANMNMLRVWGGGIYESEAFYDACDRYGILVWHDFMFSCSLYPGDEKFLESCRKEAQYQVARLRNRACMALWCGNNELEQVPHDILETEERKIAYDSLFYEVLPKVLEEDPCQLQYWPSSPHNPVGYEKGFNNPNAGDTHFWDVWHARKPVSAYMKHSSRFCSEFGMQSYLSDAGARAFAGRQPGTLNPFSPTMEAHQKNASGNLIIQEYCQRLFRAPRNYSAMAYQSQLNQMVCMRMGVEHFRRSWPYCAGALYWQLNDCWPCFSWSSLEYGGNWKALHHGAKKFFAPLVLSLVHHGEESVGLCNLTSFDEETGRFSIFATFDGLQDELSVELIWKFVDVTSGEETSTGKEMFQLQQDTSQKLTCVDARLPETGKCDPRRVVLRANLRSCCGRYQSAATGWLCSPRLCNLPPPDLRCDVVKYEQKEGLVNADIQIQSSTFAPFVELYLDPMPVSRGKDDVVDVYKPPTSILFSQNYFDVFPKEPLLVRLRIHEVLTQHVLSQRLKCRTLVDSYMG